VNHEFCASLSENPFDQLKSVATESISVLNDNSFDTSCVYLFQKGNKSISFEVESGANVADDVVVGVDSLEEFDLALEVFFLVLARDARVTDVDSRRCFLDAGDGFSTSRADGLFLDTKESIDIVLGIEALPTGTAFT
jgi:hypothetical protein